MKVKFISIFMAVCMIVTLIPFTMLEANAASVSEAEVNNVELLASTYTLRYSDGLNATSYDEDAKIIPSQKITSGVATKTTDKKFIRSGYHYDTWYIFKLVDGKAHYWCRDKATGKTGKWIAYDAIPSTYGKVSFPHGGSIYFTVSNTSIYLTPVWKQNTYTLRYSDGISTTSYDEDSKSIPNQTITSGVATKTTSKKFTRAGYQYDSWYIFRFVDGKAHYWCRDNATGKIGKWIAYDEIPSSYGKVVFPHGGELYFTATQGIIMFLTPVWKKIDDQHDGTGSEEGEGDIYWDEGFEEDFGNEDEELWEDLYEDSEDEYFEEEIIEDEFIDEEIIEEEIIEDEIIEEELFEEDFSEEAEEDISQDDQDVAADEEDWNDFSDAEEIYPPKKPGRFSVKSGRRSATLKWKPTSDADGYVIYRATKKKGKYKKIKTITDSSIVKYTNKKLKKNKKYYYKIRAYKLVHGSKYYGSCSAIKAVKVK